MKTVYPSYYKAFKCIADRCDHSCCIGWEIDIDRETLEGYRRLEGPVGEKIRSSIEWSEPPHFRLLSGDRCPHLNSDGLCDIILSLGEGALCEICQRHPRFYNYYESICEIGLGLCCEEACRLLLEEGADFDLSSEGEGTATVEENLIFAERERIFSSLRGEGVPFTHRLEALLSCYGVSFDSLSCERWGEFYLSLERLDEKWTAVVEGIKGLGETPLDKIFSTEADSRLEQLFYYFIYRYTPRALEEGGFASTVKLAAISVYLLNAARLTGGTDLCELVRMYSSEIEYSTENLDELYFELSF